MTRKGYVSSHSQLFSPFLYYHPRPLPFHPYLWERWSTVPRPSELSLHKIYFSFSPSMSHCSVCLLPDVPFSLIIPSRLKARCRAKSTVWRRVISETRCTAIFDFSVLICTRVQAIAMSSALKGSPFSCAFIETHPRNNSHELQQGGPAQP